jgi:UDP-N-acetylmuramate dehydrogenase
VEKLIEKLSEKISEENIIRNADMSEQTTFKAGGKADLLVVPQSYEELKFALQETAASGKDYYILGNGSNILVKDGGYRGVIIKTMYALQGISVDYEDEEMIVQSGVLLAVAARTAAQNMLAGMEFASGIPGSVGGAAYMNAGAYDGEMKDIITQVRLISRDGSREYTLSVDEMEYGYRHSVLYDSGDIVVSIMLKLKQDDPHQIFARMEELNGRRNEKQPLEYPSAGSFFKRPEGHFAGKLIQDAGLKGLTVGGAQVSEKHSGFVINKGGATASDIVMLMHLVQASVKEQFGVDLEPEVRIIGEDPEE